MSRLHLAFASGTLGASLTSSGTTITFAVAPSFPTITGGGDYYALTIEPPAYQGAAGSAEVVYLTAYTAAATTGTILRGQDGTAGASHANGAGWTNAPLPIDVQGPPPTTQETSGVYEVASNRQVLFQDGITLGAGGGIMLAGGLVAQTNSFPLGELGYKQVTANQTVTSATFVDLTGLTITVNIPANRKVRVMGKALFQVGANADTTVMAIFEGATQLDESLQDGTANFFCTLTPIARLTPTAGVHTYKLSTKTSIGNATTMNASATFPAFIMVEDIGINL